jgi:hypothetical protein
MSKKVTQTSIPYLAALISVSEEVRCRCHLKYLTNSFSKSDSFNDNKKSPQNNSTRISLMTHSPSNMSLLEEQSSAANSSVASNSIRNNGNSLSSSNGSHNLSILNNLQQPKRQRSCDFIDSRALILGKQIFNFFFRL